MCGVWLWCQFMSCCHSGLYPSPHDGKTSQLEFVTLSFGNLRWVTLYGRYFEDQPGRSEMFSLKTLVIENFCIFCMANQWFIEANLSYYPIGSMGRTVYLPTCTIKINHSCREIYCSSHGWSGSRILQVVPV